MGRKAGRLVQFGIRIRRQPWPAKTRILGDLRHTLGAGDVTQREKQETRIVGLQHRGHVLGDGFIVVEISSGIEGYELQWGFRLLHRSSLSREFFGLADDKHEPIVANWIQEVKRREGSLPSGGGPAEQAELCPPVRSP